VEGSDRGLISGIIPKFALEVLKKHMKHRNQDKRYTSQDSNRAPPEYKPEALLLEPAHSATEHPETNLDYQLNHSVLNKYLINVKTYVNWRSTYELCS
jgi:hypothetical protein